MSKLEQNKGRVHLYVGDGKGKTTAAVGLAVRCLGTGGKVMFTQFLKGRETGEIEPLRKLGITVRRAKCGEKFVFQMNEEEKRELFDGHRAFLKETADLLQEQRPSLLVMDEMVDAVNCGAIPHEQLADFLRNRPDNTEVVLTGRNPSPELCALVDYHTDFVCKAHPYRDEGVAARKGIEY